MATAPPPDVDGGLFMYVFNKPDPGCGLTRTFAWMWRGDLLHAVAVYPLGPVVVLGTLLAVCWAIGVLVFGRAVRLWLSGKQWRAFIITLVIALAQLGLQVDLAGHVGGSVR